MITRIRKVRRAHGLTLDDVARRCDPTTTPQTIGRLETGARKVSVAWLDRIAKAMNVDSHDLIASRSVSELKVIAVLGADGASAPKLTRITIPPRASDDQVAVHISTSLGEYRSGDELWCDVLAPADYSRALNRDVLVPRPGERFLFGRLVNRDDEKLHVLPLQPGARQQVVPSPSWIGVAARLLRNLS